MGDRWDTGRTEAFSDGVFAIAITLLVLDVRVPARLRFVDATVMRINVVLLMAASFLPFRRG